MNNRILNKDITIRVLSVVFAMLLWFYVITEQNPVLTKDITLPIKLVNTDFLEKNSMVLVDDPGTFSISLKLKGKKNVLDKIDQSSVEALADMSGHQKKGENFIRVVINGIPEGVNILTRSFDNLRVNLEPKVSMQKAVAINVMGNPSQGLAAMSAVAVPADVVVTGAESRINSIKAVRVDVDIASVNAEVKKMLPVRVLDENGKDVPNIKVEPSNIQVSIPIENTKRVPVHLETIGSPMQDYVASSMSVYPGEILITGKQQLLSGINFLKTETIDITDAAADIDREVNLVLPEGIELVNKGEKTKIYINIEKIMTKEISVESINYVNLNDSLAVDGAQYDVRATIKGAESLMNEATANMKFYVDLSHAVEGSNTLSLLWEAPQGIEVLNLSSQQVTVVLKKKN